MVDEISRLDQEIQALYQELQDTISFNNELGDRIAAKESELALADYRYAILGEKNAAELAQIEVVSRYAVLRKAGKTSFFQMSTFSKYVYIFVPFMVLALCRSMICLWKIANMKSRWKQVPCDLMRSSKRGINKLKKKMRSCNKRLHTSQRRWMKIQEITVSDIHNDIVVTPYYTAVRSYWQE